MLQGSAHNIYAAVDDCENIWGYCCYQNILDEAELLRIAVLPAKRKQGIAKALMEFSLSSLHLCGVDKIFLEVREDNIPAIKLYRNMGFCDISLRKDYYGKGAHALIMMRSAL